MVDVYDGILKEDAKLAEAVSLTVPHSVTSFVYHCSRRMWSSSSRIPQLTGQCDDASLAKEESRCSSLGIIVVFECKILGSSSVY